MKTELIIYAIHDYQTYTGIKRCWVYMRINLKGAVSHEGMHHNQYDQVALL